MNNEQIIIDGIDVSGCEHFDDSGNYNCRGCRWCKDNPNCHYKKWKRKEQECEELKDKLNCCFCKPIMGLDDIENFKKCVEITECFRRQLDKLKAENETLFKAIEEINRRIEGELKLPNNLTQVIYGDR